MSRRLSLFAGAGALVPHVIAAAQQAGYKIQVLTLTGRTDLAGVKVVAADVSNPLGIIWSLKIFRTTHIAMAGGIKLSDKAREGLARFAGGGEQAVGPVGDAALSGLGNALKAMTGATLVGVHDIAPDLLAGQGLLAGPALTAEIGDQAAFGLRTAKAIGGLDIGQAVVTAGRHIVSVEDVAGTDGLLSRVAAYRNEGLVGTGSAPLILAKASKPQQPLFVDLPAIGPETLANAAKAGVAVIAVEAGRTLLIEREKLLHAAEVAGISLVALIVPDG